MPDRMADQQPIRAGDSDGVKYVVFRRCAAELGLFTCAKRRDHSGVHTAASSGVVWEWKSPRLTTNSKLTTTRSR